MSSQLYKILANYPFSDEQILQLAHAIKPAYWKPYPTYIPRMRESLLTDRLSQGILAGVILASDAGTGEAVLRAIERDDRDRRERFAARHQRATRPISGDHGTQSRRTQSAAIAANTAALLSLI